MNVVIRTDASVHIGSGHVMRCLLLADMLRDVGANITFIIRKAVGDMADYVSGRAFEVVLLPAGGSDSQIDDAHVSIERWPFPEEKADWLIVDHYGLDCQWEEAMSGKANHLLVIDDLANRPHTCDILLDQNFFHQLNTRYEGLVNPGCHLLLGPRYVLLNPVFHQVRRSVTERNGQVQRVLVFFGGSDPTGETEKAIAALHTFDLPWQVDVVVGQTNGRQKTIRQMCLRSGYRFHIQTPKMAELIAEADLSLGAGGITMWERCFLGLPSIVTIVADNQRGSVKDTADYGAVWCLGWHEQVAMKDYVEAIRQSLAKPERLRQMSKRSMALFGDQETLNTHHPVVQAMVEML